MAIWQYQKKKQQPVINRQEYELEVKEGFYNLSFTLYDQLKFSPGAFRLAQISM